MPAQECKPLPFQQVFWARLAAELLQRRLVIKQIELRRRTHHVQEDDALGPRRKMAQLWRQRISGGFAPRRFSQQPTKSDRPQPHTGALQQRAAGHGQFWILDLGFWMGMHAYGLVIVSSRFSSTC